MSVRIIIFMLIELYLYTMIYKSLAFFFKNIHISKFRNIYCFKSNCSINKFLIYLHKF